MKGSVAQVLCFYNRLWVFKSEISLFSNTSCCTDCAAQHNTILFFSAKEIFHLKAVPRSPLVGRSAFPPGEVVILPRGMGKTWPESRTFGHLGRSKLTKSNPCTRGFFPQGGTRGAEVCPALLMVKEADEGDWATCVPQGSCTMKPLGMKQPSVTPFPSLTLGCSALTSSSKSSLPRCQAQKGEVVLHIRIWKPIHNKYYLHVF